MPVSATRQLPRHRSMAELESALDHIRASPVDAGRLELVVRRPGLGERDVLDEAELSTDVGIVGDTWATRGSKRTADGSSHPDMQLNVMNARVSRAIAGDDGADRALAGDQLHVDLDLSPDRVSVGTRFSVGSAIIEITDQPHTGCAKFAARFGPEALRFVNVGAGRELRLRGVNAKVVQPGTVRPGDLVTRIT